MQVMSMPLNASCTHALTLCMCKLRRVFDPFKIQLRICQPTGINAPAAPDASRPKARASSAVKGSASQGQEIRLVVPEIGVVMDSREFEVLTDVISHVAMAQVGRPLLTSPPPAPNSYRSP